MQSETEVPTRLVASSVEQLKHYVGEQLGVSEWHQVSQEEVDAFATATGDHQWIHTDPVRASRSPFGGTIAHGYYTLSLAPALLHQIVSFECFAMAVNYGLDKLRFPAPLQVGRTVRMRAALDDVGEFPGGATLAMTLTFESAGARKPVCVATTLYRVFEREDR
jgi:acyl dehydratase